MANTFKNKTFSANIAANTYTPITGNTAFMVAVPSTSPPTQTTLIGMTIANKTTGVISVTVALFKGSTEVLMLVSAPIPVGGALIVVGGDQKLVLETGDSVKVKSNVLNSFHIIASLLEIT